MHVAAFRGTALDFSQGDKVEFTGNWHTIGESAFQNASLNYFRLNKIEGMKHIGEGAFSGTRIGKELPGADANSVEIPTGVQSIGKEAFKYSGIKKLKFQGNSVRSIGDSAFKNNKLAELTLPHEINRLKAVAVYKVLYVGVVILGAAISLQRESKELKNLYFGGYTVTEINAQGYTPSYAPGQNVI